MISVAVMAHPQRQAWVPELVASLDADVRVVWDERSDRWDTGRRALLAHDPDATHHLVVQDDAILCRDLVAALEQAVETTGDHPLGLYVGNVRPRQHEVMPAIKDADRARAPWVRMQGPWWGVGIVLPTDHIADAVAFGDRRRDVANYDLKIARRYGGLGIDCWYPWPSLVDHRHGAANPSLVNGRTGQNRRAHRFIGADRSALDWAARVTGGVACA